MTIQIWTNVNLLTMTKDAKPYGLINDAAIVVKGGLISWLGPREQLSQYPTSEIINCHGAYMSPGLIDCHSHLVYGGNRIDEFEKRLNGTSYEEIANQGGGILSTVNATREASEDELLMSAQKRLNYFIKEGLTTIEIKSGYGLDLENEIKILRVARKLGRNNNIDIITTLLAAHALPPEYKQNREGYINLIIDQILPAAAAENLCDAVDGFCENIAFSYEEMERIFIAATKLNLRVKLHAEQLSDQNGAALAAKYHALSADHLEHLSEASIIAMKKSDTVAVLLPGAYYSLRDTKLPPIDLLRKHQVPMAVASDSNPGSSPVLSLKLMINMASTLFSLTPEEALLGVTRNAALALGLHDRGILQQELKADMVLWDISHPAELSYQVGGGQALSVIKNGTVIYTRA